MKGQLSRRRRTRPGAAVGVFLAVATLFAFSVAPTPNLHAQDGTPGVGSPVASSGSAVGLSRRDPAALGEEVVTGDYAVTLLEAVSGADAADRIATANPTNPPPGPGQEYLLARVRVRHGGESTDPVPISVTNVGSTGSAARLYPVATAVPPAPELRGQLVPNGTLDGYVVLTFAAGETSRQLVVLPGTGQEPADFRYLAIDPGASLPAGGTPVADAVVGTGAAQPGTPPNDLGAARDAPAGQGAVVVTDRFALEIFEVLRGDEATARLTAANRFNPDPLPENEHALVRVRVTHVGSEEGPFTVSPLDFALVGGGNVRYSETGLVPPAPGLDARLYPGGTAEGSLAFEIRGNEPDLSLVYQPIDDPAAAPRYLVAVAADVAATPAP